MQNLCCALIKLHLSLLFINNIAPAVACSNVIKIYPDFIWQEKIMNHIWEANYTKIISWKWIVCVEKIFLIFEGKEQHFLYLCFYSFFPFVPLRKSIMMLTDKNCIYLNWWCSLMLITKFQLMMLSFKSTLFILYIGFFGQNFYRIFWENSLELICYFYVVKPPVLLTIKESKNILSRNCT